MNQPAGNPLYVLLLRDGNIVAKLGSVDSAVVWIHNHHSYSFDHALTYEGYSVMFIFQETEVSNRLISEWLYHEMENLYKLSVKEEKQYHGGFKLWSSTSVPIIELRNEYELIVMASGNENPNHDWIYLFTDKGWQFLNTGVLPEKARNHRAEYIRKQEDSK